MPPPPVVRPQAYKDDFYFAKEDLVACAASLLEAFEAHDPDLVQFWLLRTFWVVKRAPAGVLEAAMQTALDRINWTRQTLQKKPLGDWGDVEEGEEL